MSVIDKLLIESLQIDASIGVHAWEKQVRQRIVFDIELLCDLRTAAASDDLRDAIDYVRVASRIVGCATSQHFALIETLAQQVADMLLKEFPVSGVQIRLRKPGAIAGAASVGVIVQRQRE